MKLEGKLLSNTKEFCRIGPALQYAYAGDDTDPMVFLISHGAILVNDNCARYDAQPCISVGEAQDITPTYNSQARVLVLGRFTQMTGSTNI